ncbi:Endonuclease III [Koleobacter methoxysyntrophicus]|uniref:Endonuclease III n=1 Tax=Koleobacter methoxysyntrophicus TaxID=2751313 RepID=A0A8A0RJG9_9FIRM|nr:endonuclease III [Koleobacter methoxysyntrophicus]QSQ07699.1 Endonuclease III [Koleobacter methoxysyntrophicus]
MGENRIKEILKIFEKLYPDAKTALKYDTPFQLLVATMLAAQSTDKQVNKVTSRLFKKYSGPEDFARLNPEDLEKEIRGCGLYRNKSKNIIEASRVIIDKYKGEVPRNLNDLMSLPGVGRKTANVVLSNAFNMPAFAVDTHVFRVSNRIGLAHGKNVLEAEYQLMENIPEELWGKTHHWLIYHGRQVCRARNPKCQKCALIHLCENPQDCT